MIFVNKKVTLMTEIIYSVKMEWNL